VKGEAQGFFSIRQLGVQKGVSIREERGGGRERDAVKMVGLKGTGGTPSIHPSFPLRCFISSPSDCTRPLKARANLPLDGMICTPTCFPSLVLNAQTNYSHAKNGEKAYHLGDYIPIHVHIVAMIIHIQCYNVPMFQCNAVEWNFKGFGGLKLLECGKRECLCKN